MKGPPNGKGSGDNAADSSLTLGTSLALQLRKINQADSARWRTHGEWMLERYQRTGDPRDLRALRTHLAGIRQRLAA
jgi:hypothetical protein